VARDHPLAALLPALVREARAARLDLSPLDESAIGELVASRYVLAPPDRERLIAYLAARTEGYTLFLGELLRTLEGTGTLRPGMAGDARRTLGDLDGVPVPTLLRQVITGRVARLAPDAGRLLAVAAVIGQEVRLGVWVAAARRWSGVVAVVVCTSTMRCGLSASPVSVRGG
jgi:predicted ATPase